MVLDFYYVVGHDNKELFFFRKPSNRELHKFGFA